MKKLKILAAVVACSLTLCMASMPSYAYTEEEKAQAKAWLSANGYSPDWGGANQAYQDYLNGKFDEQLGITHEDGSGEDSSGEDTSGEDSTGEDTSGEDTSEKDGSGKDASDDNPSGGNSQGEDASGNEDNGTEAAQNENETETETETEQQNLTTILFHGIGLNLPAEWTETTGADAKNRTFALTKGTAELELSVYEAAAGLVSGDKAAWKPVLSEHLKDADKLIITAVSEVKVDKKDACRIYYQYVQNKKRYYATSVFFESGTSSETELTEYIALTLREEGLRQNSENLQLVLDTVKN